MVIVQHAVMFLRLACAALLTIAGSCAGMKVARDVPIPLATPFDASPRERVEYLFAYCAGFAHALSGSSMIRCTRTREQYWQARSAGWSDGQGDGLCVWLEVCGAAIRRQDRDLLLVLMSGLGDRAAEAVDAALAEPADLR